VDFVILSGLIRERPKSASPQGQQEMGNTLSGAFEIRLAHQQAPSPIIRKTIFKDRMHPGGSFGLKFPVGKRQHLRIEGKGSWIIQIAGRIPKSPFDPSSGVRVLAENGPTQDFVSIGKGDLNVAFQHVRFDALCLPGLLCASI